MASPFISVIIVSWNARDYLQMCLRSLFRYASDHNIEVIVVDNYSGDGSVELIEQQFPSIYLIKCHTNHGFAKANNIGIKASSGDYLCFVNSDVEFIEDPFPEFIKYLNDHQKVGILGPKIIDKNGTIQRSWMRYPTLWNMFCRAVSLDNLMPSSKMFGSYLMKTWLPNKPRKIDVINGCFWFIRKTAVKQVGLLDEAFFMYGEDLDWCKRFTENKWQVMYHPGTSVIHYGGGSSANAPVRFHIEKQRAILKYWRKHHSPIKIPFVIAIIFIDHFGRLLIGGFQVIFNRHSTENRDKVQRSFSTIQWLLSRR